MWLSETVLISGLALYFGGLSLKVNDIVVQGTFNLALFNETKVNIISWSTGWF